ncbi:hypothetical protein LB524_18565 [Mesorhizobium sp. ESP6-5]|uniref:hypothetical protein n=1 Tax=Mesorhizobium sp. ESP6-5 TaxID=2876623 RepID=UPI001CCDD7F4|nr:hypothetical protein [Mesorhizobium sp. ESP6-5]MBZ9757293.1 hypothetical protein [Mesorhizobium sp. ESP6-5]
MSEETSAGPQAVVSANDNGDLVSPEGRPEETAAARLDQVVLSVARLIGRQLARETFKAANDNRPSRQGGEGRGQDGKPLGNRREDLPP